MTQREVVLSMLKRARNEGVTNGVFAEAGILRYSARIEELRRAGYTIVKERVKGSRFRYTLMPGIEGDPGGPRDDVVVSSLGGRGRDSRVSLSVESESLFEIEPLRLSHYSEAAR